MSRSVVESVARAVLYEGFALYPYRPSSLKNSRRLLLGTVEPPNHIAVECLLRAADADVHAVLAYLDPEDGTEHAEDVAAEAMRLRPDLFRVRVYFAATTRPLGAAHFVLRSKTGEWLSMIDPPADVVNESQACASFGLYPVLVGDAVLASPIILYDHPKIAPESGGDLFDATEIEEILALRVRTLSDGEKAEIRAAGGASAALLERVEAMTEAELQRVHGARRDVQRGDRVRLHPRRRADAMDVVLRGLDATVVSIDDTIEGERLFSVTIDKDPGGDLGAQGFPGHRFFFRVDELERLG